MFTTVVDFLMATPLYSVRSVGEPAWSAVVAPLVRAEKTSFRAHCSYCKADSIFHLSGDGLTLQRQHIPNKATIDCPWAFPAPSIFKVVATCQLHERHGLAFFIYIGPNGIQKVGQFPSFADAAKDADEAVIRHLPDQDRSEYRRGVGLAAHDTGIGALVYLRRVFERLIRRHFDAHKAENGWTEADFRVRMDGKIELLKDFLPQWLVENRRVYGLLSEGIHDLTEEQCTAEFPLLRQSIIVIVREDIRHAAMERERKELATQLEQLEKVRADARKENET